jgi:hypothetical protein
MIKHAAKITAINPSGARLALEEMLGFMFVRISVLGNVFSARDLHSSLFSFRRPQCVSYALSLADRWSRITCKRYPAPPRAATLEMRGAHSNFEIIMVASPGSFFLFGLCCYDFCANFFAVDPGELATTVR